MNTLYNLWLELPELDVLLPCKVKEHTSCWALFIYGLLAQRARQTLTSWVILRQKLQSFEFHFMEMDEFELHICSSSQRGPPDVFGPRDVSTITRTLKKLSNRLPYFCTTLTLARVSCLVHWAICQSAATPDFLLKHNFGFAQISPPV